MDRRLKPWHYAAIAAALLGVGLGILKVRQTAQSSGGAKSLVDMLPTDGATVAYIDAGVLRSSGILDLIAGSRTDEEPEYRKFAEQTGFDYRTDLDAAAASVKGNDSYFAVRGRFQWPKLSAYALAQSGECRNNVCDVGGSAGGRHYSFSMVGTDVLTLAVTPGPWGVMSVAPGKSARPAVLPSEPVWISAPGAVAAQMESLPLAIGVLFAPVTRAETVTVALGPQGTALQLRLEATCASPETASDVHRRISTALQALKQAAAKKDAKKNDAKDLQDWSALLSKGELKTLDRLVVGTWPVERSFLETIAASGRGE